MITEFLNALTETSEDHMTCIECTDSLWSYVHDESQGCSADELDADIGLHIKLCSHCAQEYRELRHLIIPAYSEFLPEAESRLDIDFSFLQPTPAQIPEVQPAFTEVVRHWIIQLGNLLGQATQPASPLAVAGTRSQSQDQTVLAHQEESEDFKIEITGQTLSHIPELCTVEVRVQIPSLGGPLDFDGITVQLTQGTTVLFEEETEEVRQEDLATLTCIVKADQE